MLSYRHAFHAGNHADLLKHLTFSLILAYYNRKEKPYICIDTHAGAGYYDLRSDFAQKTAEYEQGIALLRRANGALSPPLRQFLSVIEQTTQNHADYYPGSPAIAAALMRKQDYLRLCELHSSDVALLERNMREHAGALRYSISQQDGFKAALGWLPPPNRRAVVLIDPAYEVKTDYTTVRSALNTMHNRCREACLILWYPLLSSGAQSALRSHLLADFPTQHLLAELTIHRAEKRGMYGSGVFIVNPPYTLEEQLSAALPELVSTLAQDASATHKIISASE